MKQTIYTVLCYYNNDIHWAQSFNNYEDAFTRYHEEEVKLMGNGAIVTNWNNGLTICPLSTTYKIKDNTKRIICIIESNL